MGSLLRPNYVTEHFAWIIQKYGLRKLRFHDLRHPYVKHATTHLGEIKNPLAIAVVMYKGRLTKR